MILVDANLLIYAIDQDSPHHVKAKHWLEDTLSGTTEVGLAWIVILAFIRITTRHGIMRNPLPTEASISCVESWLNQPYVIAVGPSRHNWPIFRNLLHGTGTYFGCPSGRACAGARL